jgi:hypothetical protein
MSHAAHATRLADLPLPDEAVGPYPEAAPALPLYLKLVLFSVFLPEGLSFFIAGLRLTFVRLLFLLFTPMVFARLFAKMGSDRYRFVASDLFVPLMSFWMFLGPAVVRGVGDALQHSGPDVLEILIAYLSTRVLLTERGHALAFARLLCIVIAVVAVDALLDTATGIYLTRTVADTLTGYGKNWSVADEHRFGLLRAAGPIAHPILFGFMSCTGLLLSVVQTGSGMRTCTYLCAMGVVISFSSAPQQCALMGLGLLAYGRMFPNFSGKWNLLLGLFAVFAAGLFISTPTPFGHLFGTFTLDPQTAYYRLYVWNIMGPLVLDNPMFGILPSDDDYQGSVDSLWLVLSMAYGVPAAVLAALGMIGCCSQPTRGPQAKLSEAETRLGTALGVIIFLVIFVGFTVHMWASVWILVGLLTGLRAHLGELGQLNDGAPLNELAADETFARAAF